MKLGRILTTACALIALACGSAMATPSTQIWIPSPDVKGFKEFHIDVDNYMRFSPKGENGFNANFYNLGLSAGILPSENIKLEVGADMLMTSLQNDNQLDNHPFYFNAKLGTPEDAFGIKGLPAFAIGAYNLGTYDKPEVNGISTRQNIVYGLVGKTFPVIGRLSAGGYYGSERALGKGANSGVMASWDRSMPEINDKLWLAVDYMSGNNFNGEISVGGSWAFNKNVSLIVGVVFFNPFYNISATDPSNGTGGNINPGGKPALTTQLDIAF